MFQVSSFDAFVQEYGIAERDLLPNRRLVIFVLLGLDIFFSFKRGVWFLHRNFGGGFGEGGQEVGDGNCGGRLRLNGDFIDGESTRRYFPQN